MTISAVVGMQWGDEGKGKIVDALAETVDVVIRCQGGANAGHTVVLGDVVYKLHVIPSGILREGVTSVIGNGVVVDPLGLVAEITNLESKGIAIEGRLLLSDRARNLPQTRTGNRMAASRDPTVRFPASSHWRFRCLCSGSASAFSARKPSLKVAIGLLARQPSLSALPVREQKPAHPCRQLACRLV